MWSPGGLDFSSSITDFVTFTISAVIVKMTLIIFKSAVFGFFLISVYLPPENTFIVSLSFVK